MTTSLHLGGADPTRLLLPVVPAAPRPKPAFLPPSDAPPPLPGFGRLDGGTMSGYGEISSIDRNPQNHTTRVVATNANGSRYPWGEERNTETITHEADDRHPETTSVRGEYSTKLSLKDQALTWESQVEMRSDREYFYFSSVRRLLRNGVLVREKRWSDTIPRDYQ